MEMFCSKCGENLVEGTKFCPQCGTCVEGNNNSVNINPVPVQQFAIGRRVALVLGIIGIIYPLVTFINGSNKWGNYSGFPMGLIALIIISYIALNIGIIFNLKPKLKPFIQTSLWIAVGILLLILQSIIIRKGTIIP
jgi:hypothetical protein